MQPIIPGISAIGGVQADTVGRWPVSPRRRQTHSTVTLDNCLVYLVSLYIEVDAGSGENRNHCNAPEPDMYFSSVAEKR
jgi:hypothetical protein